MSFITALGTANPPHCASQDSIAEFMVKAMHLDEQEARKLRALYRMTGIDQRFSVLPDYGNAEAGLFTESKGAPSTKMRMDLFRAHALTLSLSAVQQCFQKHRNPDPDSFTHLITVSCTGLYAPGIDIEIIRSLGLRTSTQRLAINFMGCYAAFNAVKVANTICGQDPRAKVLVVCTELCSIHFQSENTQDNLLANALFGDGSAAFIMESSPQPGVNLVPESFFCDLSSEGEQDMAWTIGDFGFEMRLSAYVPDIIRQGIKKLALTLLSKISLNMGDVSYFAIHPGGKRILETIEQELGMNKDQNHDAYDVLRKYGNMSSPTVLFVLRQILDKLTLKDHNKKVLSFAFGPGLTLESMILRIHYQV